MREPAYTPHPQREAAVANEAAQFGAMICNRQGLDAPTYIAFLAAGAMLELKWLGVPQEQVQMLLSGVYAADNLPDELRMQLVEDETGAPTPAAMGEA